LYRRFIAFGVILRASNLKPALLLIAVGYIPAPPPTEAPSPPHPNDQAVQESPDE
jgi:hypothetical protein